MRIITIRNYGQPMNKLLQLWVIVVTTILLMNCAGKPMQPLSKRTAPSTKQCLSQCLSHHSACQQTCNNSCVNCQKKAQSKAAENYSKYRLQQKISGGYALRQLNSYRDPLQCRKTTCNCRADLIACKQSCYGLIKKALRTRPYCT